MCGHVCTLTLTHTDFSLTCCGLHGTAPSCRHAQTAESGNAVQISNNVKQQKAQHIKQDNRSKNCWSVGTALAGLPKMSAWNAGNTQPRDAAAISAASSGSILRALAREAMRLHVSLQHKERQWQHGDRQVCPKGEVRHVPQTQPGAESLGSPMAGIHFFGGNDTK